MSVQARIEVILADPSFDEGEDSRCEAIQQLIPELGWGPVLAVLIDLLESVRPRSDYATVAQVIWGAVLDGRELPADRIIALLYYRFDPQGGNEDNLAWSMTVKLKGVDYLSKYNPLHDPSISRELERIRSH